MNEQLPLPSEKVSTPSAMPSQRAQSWGAVISIVVIVLMVVGGAFYAWGKRVAETNSIPPSAVEAQ